MYKACAIFLGCTFSYPTKRQGKVNLLVLGATLITLGFTTNSYAYTPIANYNDDRIAEATDILFRHINGSFGALVMVSAGIAAILASAFGNYKAAVGLLVVAVGSFILRSLVATWFNDTTLQAR